MFTRFSLLVWIQTLDHDMAYYTKSEIALSLDELWLNSSRSDRASNVRWIRWVEWASSEVELAPLALPDEEHMKVSDQWPGNERDDIKCGLRG